IVPCTEYIRSWIGAPLLVKGKFIGVLNVDSAVLDAYDVATGETVMAFANQAAVAIENARLYEEVQRRLESLTNLNRASQVIASSLDMREILEQVVELAGSVVESDYTSVMLLDEAGEPVLEAEDFRGVAPIARRIRGSGVARRVLDSGQPVVVDAISAEGAMNPPLRRPDGQLMEANPDIVAADIRSFAAVPIQAKGRMMGVAFVHSRQPRAFHGQIPLLTTFANQAAVAVENARLYEDQRKRAVQAESLLRIEQAINSSLELEPTLRTVVREMAQLMGVEQSGVMLFDEKCEYGYLTVEYQEAEGVALGEELRISLEGNLSIERILTTREPLAVYDAENDPCLSTIRDIVHLRHIKSILIAPLIVRGDVIGTIGFDATEAPRHFTEGEIRLSQILAGRAAIAIENARLFEETQKHVACLEKKTRDLELVHQVSQTVSSSLNLTHILETTVEQMVTVFETDHSGILLLDQAQTYGQVVAEYPSSGAAAERFPIQGYLVAERIIADREPLMIEDVWNDPLMATVREAMHRLDIRSMLIAPLIVKGEVLGSIGLDAVGQQRRFSAEEVALAQTIANQVAIAIENARLFEEAQRRVHQLSTLNRVGRRVASILDRQRLLQQAVNAVRDDLGYFRAAVLLVNEGDNDLYVAAATDNFWRVIPVGYRQPVGKGAVGTAAQTGE
ncbi:MAG: GAF domain-containing protein, partial [Chloroflexota bacterium]|nr:GAF domain-containing protein [Chloroflexota bacterium]